MKPINSFKYVFSKLDIFLAIFGIILGIILPLLYFLKSPTMMILIIGIALLIVSPLYLYFRLKNPASIIISADLYLNNTAYFKKRVGIISNITFWIIISIGFLVLLAIPNIRTPVFFFLVAISAGLIVVSILSISEKSASIFHIIKILILGLQVRLSVFLFYGGSGVDYWEHLKMNALLAQSGDILSLWDKEVSYPLMHISTAVSEIMTSLPIKEATGIAILLPLTISVICVYLFGREFFGERVGLLAALIVMVCDYPIMWSYSSQTTSFGLCIFYFCIFIIGKAWKNNKKYIWSILFLFISFILLLTHAVSSYILEITLIAFFIAGCGYYFHNKQKYPKLEIFYLLSYTLSLVILWFYATYNEKSVFFDQIILTLYNSLSGGDVAFLNRVDGVLMSGEYSESFLSLFIDSIGYLIIITFCIGVLYLWLHPKNQRKISYSIIVAFLLLQFVTYVFPLFGMRNIMPSRWFAFMYFFFAIMMAVGCVFLLRKKKRFALILPIVIMIFALIMVSGSVANLDSPLNSGEYRISTTYTFSEVHTSETIAPYLTNYVISDERYVISLFKDYNQYGYVKSFTSSDSIDTAINSVLIYREYLKERPIRIMCKLDGYYDEVELPIVIGDSYDEYLKQHSIIYTLGSVKAYWI